MNNTATNETNNNTLTPSHTHAHTHINDAHLALATTAALLLLILLLLLFTRSAASAAPASARHTEVVADADANESSSQLISRSLLPHTVPRSDASPHASSPIGGPTFIRPASLLLPGSGSPESAIRGTNAVAAAATPFPSFPSNGESSSEKAPPRSKSLEMQPRGAVAAVASGPFNSPNYAGPEERKKKRSTVTSLLKPLSRASKSKRSSNSDTAEP